MGARLDDVKWRGVGWKAKVVIRAELMKRMDRHFSEAAYWRVMNSLKASGDQVQAMLPEYVIAFHAGNAKDEHAVVERFLPEGSWRWPAYDAFAEPRDRAFAEEDEEPIDEWEPDYHEMVVLLCRRISAFAYEERRRAQRSDPGLLQLRPLWMFHVGETEQDGMPAECKARDGKKFSPTDPVWECVPPCDFLECCCYVSAAK